MGVVLRARAPDGAEVAVKLLKSLDSPDTLARFERERRLLASLGEDAGFVPLLDAGDGPAGPWLAMPFLAGGTLRDRLLKGPLAIEATIALGRSLARALGRAHRNGV